MVPSLRCHAVPRMRIGVRGCFGPQQRTLWLGLHSTEPESEYGVSKSQVLKMKYFFDFSPNYLKIKIHSSQWCYNFQQWKLLLYLKINMPSILKVFVALIKIWYSKCNSQVCFWVHQPVADPPRDRESWVSVASCSPTVNNDNINRKINIQKNNIYFMNVCSNLFTNSWQEVNRKSSTNFGIKRLSKTVEYLNPRSKFIIQICW